MRGWITAMLCVALVAGPLGCATRNMTSAADDGVRLRVSPQDYHVLGPVKGKDCVGRFLIFQVSSPDLLVAEKAALGAAPGAQILLNKHVYAQGETIFPLVLSRSCFFVEGLAIRLK